MCYKIYFKGGRSASELEVNISRYSYEIRNAELLERKWTQFPMGV
jgi:hypothetical protein